jgi:DNA-binding response OmpR family regulator
MQRIGCACVTASTVRCEPDHDLGAQDVLGPEKIRPISKPIPRSRPYAGPDVRVLVVGPRIDWVGTLREWLADAHHQVRYVSEVTLAFAECTDPKLDLLMVCWSLPGVDGLDVCRRVRSLSNVPIMVVGTRTGIQVRVNALESGPDVYVTLDVGRGEMLARMNALVRRARLVTDEHEIRSGNLLISLQQFRVDVAGVDLKLSRQEYKLLRVCAITGQNLLESGVGGSGLGRRSTQRYGGRAS